MKKILAAFLLLAWLPALAQSYKVIDRSEKKTPEWLYRLPEGSLLVEVERPTLGEAQGAAEDEIRRRILSAISTNVEYRTQEVLSEKITSERHDLLESFEAKTATNAARLPFLSGITLTNARATYWEKRSDKKTARDYVVLSVCYPFPKSQQEALRREFEATDQSKAAELAALREGIGEVDSSATIEEALSRLAALEEYFFDRVRLAQTQALAKEYNGLYKGLTLTGEVRPRPLSADGKVSPEEILECHVMLNGHPFKVTARPGLKSNCANSLRCEHADAGATLLIHYNAEDCLADEENWIEVSLRLKHATLRERFRI